MNGFLFLLEKMALITSTSGIRGTIGGESGQNLTPEIIVHIVKCFGQFILQQNALEKPKVIIGRDARSSGQMIESIVTGTLAAMGIDCICLGITTTPTTELAVINYKANGGIIITASHNPEEWNALKLLNNDGEFINEKELEQIQQFDNSKIIYPNYKHIGKIEHKDNYVVEHVQSILSLPFVDYNAIRQAQLNVVADCINSSGAIALPTLFNALGIENYILINQTIDGNFAHNPEPLADNLSILCQAVKHHKADIGIAVDPDVDRLALITENGLYMGEEYTQIMVADYILQHYKGPIVTNVSSSIAMDDIAKKYAVKCYRSAVGEVNVVTKMKEVNAIFGGEGNGGVILPQLHYGRDALIGIALILSYIAKAHKPISLIYAKYPKYIMVKHKINMQNPNIDLIFNKIEEHFNKESIDKTDGLKVIFSDQSWVQVRASKTEPILRIYAEAIQLNKAQYLVDLFKNIINNFN